jgi:hypothetical protein
LWLGFYCSGIVLLRLGFYVNNFEIGSIFSENYYILMVLNLYLNPFSDLVRDIYNILFYYYYYYYAQFHWILW